MNINLETTNFYGQIGAIICWYHDDDNMAYDVKLTAEENGETLTEDEINKEQTGVDDRADNEQNRIAHLISIIPQLDRREFDEISKGHLFYVYDALGSYPDRNEQLEELYKAVGKAWSEK
ncbi:MAG: hypothetical protein ACW99G_02530 [Candidatus Thorarchaeota archaeon]|jgi:hypothetical protein